MRLLHWLPSLLLIFALGCGSGSGTSTTKTDTPDGGDGGEGGETPAANLPEMYRFPIADVIPTLDPAQVTDTVSSAVVGQIFDGLVKISPDGDKLLPAVAESWTVEEEGRKYSFVIRKGIKFHNGRELTAEDVKYSFNRILSPETNSPRTFWIDSIRGARTFMDSGASEAEGIVTYPDDPYRLELYLEVPTATFLYSLAQSNCVIVPKEAVEDPNVEFANNPVGTGPFKVTAGSYNPSEGITLEAFPDYFRGAPKIKGIQYIVEKEEKKRFEGFKAGLYEHTDIPADEVEGVKGDPELSKLLVEKPTFDLHNVTFNCDKPPFKDNPKLRQALNYAVDKDYIANTLMKGTMVPSKSYVPNDFPGVTVNHGAYPFDPVKAAELLKEAGYPGGEGLPVITLHVDTKEANVAIMTAVQNDLAKLGIKSELRTLEWGSFLKAMDQGEHLIGQATWLMDYPDADNIYWVLFNSVNKGANGNHAFYGNELVDKLSNEARIGTDPAARNDLYSQAEAQLFLDAPWILLCNKKCMILKQPYVQGLELTKLDRAPQIPGVDLETVEFR